MKKLWTLLGLFAGASSAFAASKITVQGVVRDSGGVLVGAYAPAGGIRAAFYHATYCNSTVGGDPTFTGCAPVGGETVNPFNVKAGAFTLTIEPDGTTLSDMGGTTTGWYVKVRGNFAPSSPDGEFLIPLNSVPFAKVAEVCSGVRNSAATGNSLISAINSSAPTDTKIDADRLDLSGISGDSITSGTVAGTTAINTSGNITTTGSITVNSAGTTGVFSSAAAGHFRIHAAGDGYGGNAAPLVISGDRVAAGDWKFMKGVADYNGTPVETFNVTGEGGAYFAGNVGIGTAAPGAKLDVVGPSRSTSSTDGYMEMSNYGGASNLGFQLFQSNTVAATGRDMVFNNWSNTGTGGGFLFANSANNAGVARLTPDGYLAIGATNPTYALDVSGANSSVQLRLRRTSSNAGLVDIGADDLGFHLHPNGYGNGEKFTVLQNGYVGIGTSSPSSNLHVNSAGTATLKLSGTSTGYTNAEIVLSSLFTGQPNYRGLGTFMHDDAGQTEWFAGRPYASSDKFIISRKASTAAHDASVSETSNALLTVENTGYVGIGTLSPTDKLAVEGSGATTASVKTSTASTYSRFMTQADQGAAGYADLITYGSTAAGTGFGAPLANKTLLYAAGTSSEGLILGSHTNKPLILGTNDAERMRISESGNVGIGTTSPQTTLHVNQPGAVGGIRLSRTSFPDEAGFTLSQNASSNSVLGIGSVASPFHTAIELSTGNVGLGTSNPVGRLHVAGGAMVFSAGDFALGTAGTMLVVNATAANGASAFQSYVNGGTGNGSIALNAGGGNVGIGTNTPSEKLHVIGNILASGTVTGSSDRRLKKNIRPIEDALAKVCSLNGVGYEWIEPEKHNAGPQIGVIAQDVEKVFPEAVLTGSDGMKSVSYVGLVAPVIEAVKELYAKFTHREEKVDRELERVKRTLASVEAENGALRKATQQLEERLKKLENERGRQ